MNMYRNKQRESWGDHRVPLLKLRLHRLTKLDKRRRKKLSA